MKLRVKTVRMSGYALRAYLIISMSLFRSAIALAAVLFCSGACLAATFSFDGFIERETANSNDDHHTLDFFRINVPSPTLLTIVGTEGTLPDLSIMLYRQGERG